MRRKFNPVSFAQRGDLEYLSQSPSLGYVGLCNIDRALGNHCHKIVEASRILPCGDSMKSLSSHGGKATEVLGWPHWLLEPVQAEILELVALWNCVGNRPRTISIQH